VIAALGLLAGIALGLVLDPTVPLWAQPYLPIAVVAALDAVFGGLRALLDGIFDDKVFVVSFLSNVVVAALIVFLGDQLGVGASSRPASSSCWGSGSSPTRPRSAAPLPRMSTVEPGPEAAAGEHPSGCCGPRRTPRQVIAALLLAALGFGLVVQVRATQDAGCPRCARAT
jgi:small basic protein